MKNISSTTESIKQNNKDICDTKIKFLSKLIEQDNAIATPIKSSEERIENMSVNNRARKTK